MKKTILTSVISVATSLACVLALCAAILPTADVAIPNVLADTTSTTTAIPCYATQLSYDSSPMTVGETRAIRFYHPATQSASDCSIDEVSANISYTYDKGSDMVYVTALAPGKASLYIRESDCAFGAYARFDIEEATVLKGDVNFDGIVSTADARIVLFHCISPATVYDTVFSTAADFDGNGTIESSDVRGILMQVMKH